MILYAVMLKAPFIMKFCKDLPHYHIVNASRTYSYVGRACGQGGRAPRRREAPGAARAEGEGGAAAARAAAGAAQRRSGPPGEGHFRWELFLLQLFNSAQKTRRKVFIQIFTHS